MKLISHTTRHATFQFTRRELDYLAGATEDRGGIHSRLWNLFQQAKSAMAEATPRSPGGLTEDETDEQEVVAANGWGMDEAAEELLRRRDEA